MALKYSVLLCILNGLLGCGGVVSTQSTSGSQSIVYQFDKIKQHPVADIPVEDVMHVVVSKGTPLASVLAGRLAWESSGFFEDGSIMTIDEVSHYEVLYGLSPEELHDTIAVDKTGILNFDIKAVAEKTWYLGVKTVSVYGGVSQISSIIAFDI